MNSVATFESALFCDSANGLDADGIVRRLAAGAQVLPLPELCSGESCDDRDARLEFRFKSIDALITLSPAPLPRNAADRIAASVLACLTDPRTLGALSRHRRVLTITVTDTQPCRTRVGQPDLLPLRVLHALTLALSDMHQPRAVLWRQSGRLLTREEVLDQRAAQVPLAYCHAPRPFSNGARRAGRRLAGIRAQHSEDLIGRTVILHETTLPFGEGCALIRDVLHTMLAQPEGFARGKPVQLDGWPVIHIGRRAPSEAFPGGTLELDLDDSAEAPQGDPLKAAFRGSRHRAALLRPLTRIAGAARQSLVQGLSRHGLDDRRGI